MQFLGHLRHRLTVTVVLWLSVQAGVAVPLAASQPSREIRWDTQAVLQARQGLVTSRLLAGQPWTASRAHKRTAPALVSQSLLVFRAPRISEVSVRDAARWLSSERLRPRGRAPPASL